MLLVMQKRIKLFTWTILMMFILISVVVAGDAWSTSLGKSNKGTVAFIKNNGRTVKVTSRGANAVAKVKIKKMQQPDTSKLIDRLDSIEKEEWANFEVINKALDTQDALINAGVQGADTSMLLGQHMEGIKAAKNALIELEKLKDERISIYNATTKDQRDIAVANSTYNAWAKTVDMLVPEPLKSKEFEKRVKAANEATMESIACATEDVKSVQMSDLDNEDKQILAEEVIPEGKDVQANYNEALSQVGVILAEIIKIILATKAYGGGGRGLALGIATVMAANVLSGDSPFKLINATKKLFKLMGEHTKKMNTAVNGYMQATGELAGVKVEAVELVEPDLSADGQQGTDVQQE